MRLIVVDNGVSRSLRRSTLLREEKGRPNPGGGGTRGEYRCKPAPARDTARGDDRFVGHLEENLQQR